MRKLDLLKRLKKDLAAVKQGYNDDGTRRSLQVCRDRTTSNRYNMYQWKFWLNTRRKKMTIWWNRLPRDPMDSPSSEIFKTQAHQALNILFSVEVLQAKCWARWLTKIPSNIYNSMHKAYKEKQINYSIIFCNIYCLSTGGKILLCIKLWKKNKWKY